MLYQLFLKRPNGQWDLFGAGEEFFVAKLLEEYLTIDKLYGQTGQTFHVVRSYYQPKEEDRPIAYCPTCDEARCYCVKHQGKRNEKTNQSYQAFICECEHCKTEIQTREISWMTNHNRQLSEQ